MSLYSALTQVLAPFAARIKGIQTGYDGTEYDSPGEAVREQINDLHVLIGHVPGQAIDASAVAYNDSNVAAELTGVNGRLERQQGIIAEAFSVQSTYNVGDSVIYEASLYTFKANKTAGSWDVTKVDGPFKVTEQISNLKEDLSDVTTLLTDEVYTVVPLTFDISGYYKNGNLSVLDTSISDSKTCIISVSEGDKYKVSGKSCSNQKLVCVYDSSDNILLTIMPENNEQTLTDYEFTIPTGGVKMALSMLHSYLSYLVTLQKAEIAIKKLTTDNVDFFGAVNPVNLYDYQSTVDGEYMNPDGTTATRADLCYAYIPVSSGTYTLHACANFFGRTVASRIPVFDADKNYLNYVTGTYITDRVTNLEELTITVSSGVKYIGLTSRLTFKNAVMVVSGDSMPTEFIPYVAPYSALEDTQKVKATNIKGGDVNPLYAKVVAFDGDSICHGTSAQDGKSGWAGRIGNANAMNWKNYGISGGTITTLASHSVLSSIDDIYGYMPMLDYYIFEGGTNDADRLGLDGIGTVTENDYGGTYDTNTFSGALESLIYKALTYYPTAKIGYIVAQKMGKTNNANYAKRKAFFDRAMEICKKWGIPYINLWDGSHLNPNLSSMYDSSLDADGNISANKLYVDGQHLTPTGYDVITPIIEAWMKTL